MISLLDVYEHPEAVDILYRLIGERQMDESISHKEMPSFEKHKEFVERHPYMDWQLISVGMGYENSYIVGAIYLTYINEIGVFIFKKYRGKDYGKKAITLLMLQHPKQKFLANINPDNKTSIKLFENIGFKHIQNTYEL